jgi:hypothetical protein
MLCFVVVLHLPEFGLSCELLFEFLLMDRLQRGKVFLGCDYCSARHVGWIDCAEVNVYLLSAENVLSLIV